MPLQKMISPPTCIISIRDSKDSTRPTVFRHPKNTARWAYRKTQARTTRSGNRAENQPDCRFAGQYHPQIKLGDIALSKIKIGYDSENAQLNTGLTLDKSLIRFNNLDIQKQIIDLQGLDITSLKGSLRIGSSKRKWPRTSQLRTRSSLQNPGKSG
jgi:hypothetical protein